MDESGEMAAGASYEVVIENLTEGQPLSPPIVVAHGPDHHVWQTGQLASPELTALAEDGDNSQLAAAEQGMAGAVEALSDPIPPGGTATVTISAHEGDVLSAATMLVRTNDGFTGLDGLAIGDEATTQETMAYDAGTENNTELSSDVPGPPYGGTNRAPTDPPQPIASHEGLRGDADVSAEYDWEGPVARFTVRPLPGAMPSTGLGGAQAAAPTTPLVLGGLALLGLLGLGLWTTRRRIRVRS